MILDDVHRILENLDCILQPSKVAPAESEQSFWISKIPGTIAGFEMGSTASTKEVEHVDQKKKGKEENVIQLVNSLANILKPQRKEVEGAVLVLLKKSCLIPVVVEYLRNDSVLDLSDHVSLYRAIVQLLRSIASVPGLQSLLVSREGDSDILKLLLRVKSTLEDYSKLLATTKINDSDMLRLIPDFEATIAKVEEAVKGSRSQLAEAVECLSTDAPLKTLQERYVEEMKKLQFSFMEMVDSFLAFTVPFKFKNEALKNWAETGEMIHSRQKRLAQELVTLSKSLPLSYGSSIFLRCDHNRLDVIKVLITGPAGTPYSNGCFEFDIHFPLDYPKSPPMVHFRTTGGQRVRFNPNLFQEGHVCMSGINTWEGTPEEQWDPKKSSLLPVLVAIQGLIFIDQPYWNDPFALPDRGTASGEKKSMEYNSKIRHFTLKYAILDQIKNPTSCFKEVIHRHFWMKREEILEQCKGWGRSSVIRDLKATLSHMMPPEGLEGYEIPMVENTVSAPRNQLSRSSSKLDQNSNPVEVGAPLNKCRRVLNSDKPEEHLDSAPE